MCRTALLTFFALNGWRLRSSVSWQRAPKNRTPESDGVGRVPSALTHFLSLSSESRTNKREEGSDNTSGLSGLGLTFLRRKGYKETYYKLGLPCTFHQNQVPRWPKGLKVSRPPFTLCDVPSSASSSSSLPLLLPSPNR